MNIFGESPEAGKMRLLGPEQVSIEVQKWAELQKSIEHLRDHPSMRELDEVAAHASTILNRILLLSQFQGSGERINHSWEEIGKLYNTASRLRASMLGDGIRVSMGIEQGVPLQDGMVSRLQSAFAMDNNQSMKSIVQLLEPFARGLAVDPNSVQANTSIPGNIFYSRGKDGRLIVNMRALTQAHEALNLISPSALAHMNPQQQEVLRGMRLSLDQLAAVDPVRAQLAARYWARDSRPADMRPLRVVTGIGGCVIAGLGIGMGLRKGGQLTWPTFLWGGIAAISMFPDALNGQAYQAVKGLQFMSTPEAQMVLKQIDPIHGPAAIAEAVALRTKKPQDYALLARSTTPVTRAQMERLVGTSDSALLRVMDRVPEADRAIVLGILAKPSSKDEVQIMQKYVQQRNNMQATFMPDARASMGATPMGLLPASPMPMQYPMQPGNQPPGAPQYRTSAHQPYPSSPQQQYQRQSTFTPAPGPSHWMITGNGSLVPAPGSYIKYPGVPVGMPVRTLPQQFPTMPPVFDLGPHIPEQDMSPVYGQTPGSQPQAWQMITTPVPAPRTQLGLGPGTPIPPFRFEDPRFTLGRLIGPQAPMQPWRVPLGQNIFYRGPVYYTWHGRPAFLPTQPTRNYPPNRAWNPMLQNRYPLPSVYPPPPGRPTMGPFPSAPGWRPHN